MEDGMATTPLAFSRFLDIMNSDQAKDLVRRINTFMKDLRQRTPAPDLDGQLVQAFLEEMETAMAKHPLFSGSTPQELDAATEALEKYLMTKLHDRTFGMAPEDTERDSSLGVRCEALQFVAPHHLEIKEGVVHEGALEQAAIELNRMTNYKAPRDKLVCILNCCRVINNMLHSGPRGTDGAAGADDFTPLLILAVIKARPPRLGSNIGYIERYRMRSKLSGEAAYYFVQLCSAATFIEMVDASSLHGVSADEFLAHMLQSGALSDEQLKLMGAGGSGEVRDAAAAAAAGGQQQQPSAGARGPSPLLTQAPPPTQQQQQPVQMNALPVLASPPRPAGPYQQPQAVQPVPQQQQQVWGASYGYNQQPPPPPPAAQQQHWAPFPPQLTVAQLEAQGARLLADSGGSTRLAERHPFCFTPLEALTVGDVGKLLRSYKELVLRYESLAVALDYCYQNQQQAAAAAGRAYAAPVGTTWQAALGQQQQQQQAAAGTAASGTFSPLTAGAAALSPLASPGGSRSAVALPRSQLPGSEQAAATSAGLAAPVQPPAAATVAAKAAPASRMAPAAGGSDAPAAASLVATPAPLPDDVLAQLMGEGEGDGEEEAEEVRAEGAGQVPTAAAGEGAEAAKESEGGGEGAASAPGVAVGVAAEPAGVGEAAPAAAATAAAGVGGVEAGLIGAPAAAATAAEAASKANGIGADETGASAFESKPEDDLFFGLTTGSAATGVAAEEKESEAQRSSGGGVSLIDL